MDRMIEICVLSKVKTPVYFIVEEGFLRFNQLKQYFPTAVGLSYEVDGHTHVADHSDDKLQLHSNVFEYRLLTEEGTLQLYLYVVIFHA